MNELVRTLQARIRYLEIEIARYENARVIGAVELGYWRGKALSTTEPHPDSELGKLLQFARNSAGSSCACGTSGVQDDRLQERQAPNPAPAEPSLR